MRLALPIMLVAALQAASAVHAQAPDAADVAEGMRLFRQKANCQACHGWAGDGRKMDDQMPDGANLREIALSRDELIVVIFIGGRALFTLPRRMWDGINDNLDPVIAVVATGMILFTLLVLIAELSVRARRAESLPSP